MDWRDLGRVQGEQGPQGEQGETGPQGPQGIQGETGATGPQGPAGPQGATGPQGPQGATGDEGFSPTISILDITGGHRLTIVTADSVQFVDIMDGVDGATGPQGPAGPQGEQGPQGETGATGATGATGEQGPAGEGVPTGGDPGQVLRKYGSSDYATYWADVNEVPSTGNIGQFLKRYGTDPDQVMFDTIHQIPSGGGVGQVLTKASGDDYDAIWDSPSTLKRALVEIDIGSTLPTAGQTKTLSSYTGLDYTVTPNFTYDYAVDGEDVLIDIKLVFKNSSNQDRIMYGSCVGRLYLTTSGNNHYAYINYSVLLGAAGSVESITADNTSLVTLVNMFGIKSDGTIVHDTVVSKLYRLY